MSFSHVKMRAIRNPALAAATILLTLAACTGDSTVTGPTPIAPPSVRQVPLSGTVVTNPATLAGFVKRGANRAIPLVRPTAVSPSIVRRSVAGVTTAARQGNALQLVLDVEVEPPVVDGKVLQATHIAAAGGRVYVTYAMIGEGTAGAIDVFDLGTGSTSTVAAVVAATSDTRLIARMTFAATEYYAVTATDDALYVVGASDDPELTERAVLDVYGLRDGIFDSKPAFRRIALPSFAGTGVHVQNGLVWATSGSGGPNVGGVTVFAERDFSVIARETYSDARAVHGAGRYVVVLTGTPGGAMVFDAGNAQYVAKPFVVGGATVPESKGSAWVEGNWAFLGAGDGGVRVFGIAGSRPIINGEGIPTPEVRGVPRELSTTNAVTTNGSGLVFTANGEAGVLVYTSDYLSLSPGVTRAAPRFDLLGALDFGEKISANFIASSEKQLFVASGLGGLKILRIQ